MWKISPVINKNVHLQTKMMFLMRLLFKVFIAAVFIFQFRFYSPTGGKMRICFWCLEKKADFRINFLVCIDWLYLITVSNLLYKGVNLITSFR